MVSEEMSWNGLKVTCLVVSNMSHTTDIHQALNILLVVCHKGLFLGRYYFLFIWMIYKRYVIHLPRYSLLMIQICFYKSLDKSILEKQINNELRQVSLWLKVNKLYLNVLKTHYIVFTRKSNTVTSVDIRIENQAINEVNKTKFPGVIIDKKLTWKEHISYLSSKISRGIGMIIKVKKRLNKDSLVTLYYSFIYPYRTYCNHVWGTACITQLNKISILQKKAIRIICNVNRRTPTDPLFRDLKIIPFLHVNIYSIARFMFRYVNGSLPKPFVGYFTTNANIHSYNTRQTLHFHLPNVRSDLGKRISNITEVNMEPFVWFKHKLRNFWVCFYKVCKILYKLN